MHPRAWPAICTLLVAAAAHADGSVRAPGDGAAPRAATGTVDDLLPRIARRLQALKTRLGPLRDFDERKAIVLFNPLHRETLGYHFGVSEVPNPDYARQVREREAEPPHQPPLLRGPIPTTVRRLGPDAIALTIDLYPDGGATMQRMFIPYATVGAIAIELRLEAGRDAAPIAAAIRAVVRDETLRTAGARLVAP